MTFLTITVHDVPISGLGVFAVQTNFSLCNMHGQAGGTNVHFDIHPEQSVTSGFEYHLRSQQAFPRSSRTAYFTIHGPSPNQLDRLYPFPKSILFLARDEVHGSTASTFQQGYSFIDFASCRRTSPQRREGASCRIKYSIQWVIAEYLFQRVTR